MNRFDRQQLQTIIQHQEFQTNNLSPTNQSSLYNYSPIRKTPYSPYKVNSQIQPISTQQSITPQKKQYDLPYCPNPDYQKTARSKSLTPSKNELDRLFTIQSQLKTKISTYIQYIEQSKKEEEMIQATKSSQPILQERFSFQNQQAAVSMAPVVHSMKQVEKENNITVKRPTISTEFSTSKQAYKKESESEKVNQFIEKYERMLTFPNQEAKELESYLGSTAQSSKEYPRVKTSKFGKTCQHEDEESLLNKLEMIQCQLGIKGRQRCVQTDQSDEASRQYANPLQQSTSSELDKNQNTRRTRLETQEQQFSPSLDSEAQQLSKLSKQENVPEFTQIDSEGLECIQEAQNEETEEEQFKHYCKNLTPSQQDARLNQLDQSQADQSSKKEFRDFYDKRMIYSLLKIDKNIKRKEQEYHLKIDEQRKSFDQYYQEYITDEVNGLEGEISEIQKYPTHFIIHPRFLKKVRSSNKKLKSSLKDLYRTITFNQNDISTDDKPWIKSAISTPFTKQNTSQSSSDDRNITNIQQRIIDITKDLGQIDEIRKIMVNDLENLEGNYKRQDGIKHLKYLKGQINDQFQKVEKDIRLLNEEYSESDTNGQTSKRGKFETQKQQMQREEMRMVNRNFETEYDKVYEFDEEESSQYC